MEDRKGPPSQTPIYLWILAVAQVVPVVQVLGPFGPSGSVAPVAPLSWQGGPGHQCHVLGLAGPAKPLCNKFLVYLSGRSIPEQRKCITLHSIGLLRFGVCSRRHCCIPLPLLVLVGVRVVAYTANNKTWKVVHQPCRFYSTSFSAASVSRTRAFFINWFPEAIRP
jgi:hypothetical protein